MKACYSNGQGKVGEIYFQIKQLQYICQVAVLRVPNIDAHIYELTSTLNIDANTHTELFLIHSQFLIT